MLLSLAHGRVLEVLEVRGRIALEPLEWVSLLFRAVTACSNWISVVQRVCRVFSAMHLFAVQRRPHDTLKSECMWSESRKDEVKISLAIDRYERYDWWRRSIDRTGHRSSPFPRRVSSTGTNEAREKHLLVLRYVGHQSIGRRPWKDKDHHGLICATNAGCSCAYLISVNMIVQIFFDLFS